MQCFELLLFINKCLNVFIDFKTKLNVIFNDLKLNLNSNEIKMFEDLDNKYNEVLNERQLNETIVIKEELIEEN